MSLEAERAVTAQWRTLNMPSNESARQSFRVAKAHNVDECGCFTCSLCRSTESCLAEIDRLTGAGFEDSHGGTPLGT